MADMPQAEEGTGGGKQEYLMLIVVPGQQQENSLCKIKTESRIVTPIEPILNYLWLDYLHCRLCVPQM